MYLNLHQVIKVDCTKVSFVSVKDTMTNTLVHNGVDYALPRLLNTFHHNFSFVFHFKFETTSQKSHDVTNQLQCNYIIISFWFSVGPCL